MGEQHESISDHKDQAAVRFAPHLRIDSVLDPAAARALLDYAIAAKDRFQSTAISRDGGSVRPDVRFSVGTRELGPFADRIKSRVKESLPDWLTNLGMKLENPRFELQLVAHNHGAFYSRHIDTRVGGQFSSTRVLSAVYYFFREPKAFEGGALRYYSIFGNQYIDIEPVNNTMVVFPSFVPHEVLPVICPSGLFEDSRFAVNCWAHRRTAEP